MLLSMDRAFIFSRENLERLYMMWDLDRHGRCRVLDTVRTLFADKDGSEKADKVARFYTQLSAS